MKHDSKFEKRVGAAFWSIIAVLAVIESYVMYDINEITASVIALMFTAGCVVGVRMSLSDK